jgi:hypothetical protein
MATGHERELTDTGRAVLDVLSEFYDRDVDAQHCDSTLLRELVRQKHPHNYERVYHLLDTLEENPAVENIREILLGQRKQHYRELISIALMEGRDDDAADLWSEMGDLSLEAFDEDLDEYCGTDPTVLLAAMEAGNRIPLVCDQLTEHTRGGAIPGHHLLFFGRPEIGKSLAAFNLVRTAGNAGHRVGFWENEDPISATQLRCAQAICNATEGDVRVNLGRYQPVLEAAGWYDRIFFKESADGSVREIEAWVEKHDLDLVIVNQLPNLKAASADTRIQELWAIARGLRALAKRQQCVVASVAQAGDSADGKRVLRLGDLDGSNTAVQGQVDLMVGIGMDQVLEETHQRCLSLIRNKLSGQLSNLFVKFDAPRNYME